MTTVQLVEDVDAACAVMPEWDELARAGSLPHCSPGWMLAWWRHLAPSATELRIVAVRDGGELVALAPWFVQRHGNGRVDIRFLGAEISDRVDVLCRRGFERDVARALRKALFDMRPRPNVVSFEAVPIASVWTRMIASGTGGVRLARYRNSVRPAPAVALPGGPPEAWLAGRSSNFRGQMTRLRRRLEQRGGCIRQMRAREDVDRTLDAMLALHTARWEGREETWLTKQGVRELLHDAAEMLGPDRLRLWAAELDGELISVQLFLAAGSMVKYWNGGWAQEHGDLKPSMLTILAALEDAIVRGERRMDLGVGEHPYKLRFANDNDALTWGGMIVRDARWPRTRAELAPRILRYRAKQVVLKLPAPISDRVATAVRARRNGA